MKFETVSPELSVSGQIQSSDVEAIKAAGFRTIICNRPDGEAGDQPNFAKIRRAASAVGIEARYIPVQASGVTLDNISDFAVALHDLPNPVLAYCRSGTRSATLWSRLVEQAGQSA